MTATIETINPKQAAVDLATLMEPVDLLRETLRLFEDRVAISTSGQLTGCALIDMASRTGLPFRVFAVDTLRLHPETYQLWDRLEAHYGITIDRFRPDAAVIERMVRQHGEYLFFDSKAKQEYCCQKRKVEPHRRALSTVDAWVTGLRRDQSEAREGVQRVQLEQIDGRPLVKVCPLAEWTEQRVREYIAANSVPYNPLFDRRADGSRYDSLGCVICTTPVLPHEPPRAGRWRWFNSLIGNSEQKECGIHLHAAACAARSDGLQEDGK